ncbi:MAG: hypothetical protein FWG30_07560 [Eubacteriaceae bacterium]|nr:hypothetical protein [Eubacteriaceae bacterium]
MSTCKQNCCLQYVTTIHFAKGELGPTTTTTAATEILPGTSKRLNDCTYYGVFSTVITVDGTQTTPPTTTPVRLSLIDLMTNESIDNQTINAKPGANNVQLNFCTAIKNGSMRKNLGIKVDLPINSPQVTIGISSLKLYRYVCS